MSERRDRAVVRVGLVLLMSAIVGVAGAPPAAEAGADEAGPAMQEPPDFLFEPPGGWVGVRAGWLFARADGELFDFVRELLTIERRDFDAAGIGVDVGLVVNSHVEAVVGFAFERARVDSEFRDFVDVNDLPIAQQSELLGIDLTGSLKIGLVPRGRSVGQFAWIPSVVTPYVGGGGGAFRYRFRQQGDFVDDVDLSIFSDILESSAWTLSGHVFAGAHIKLTRRLFATFEVRQRWADAPLRQDFLGFDNIDLAGLKVIGGIDVLF